MRIARSILLTLVVLLALGAPLPAAAQDDGVGFEDMPGLRQAVARTMRGEGFDPAVGSGGARQLRKPVVSMMLTAVYTFDSEASASASYELLKTDMNATGIDGQPLTITETTLPLAMEYTAGRAIDDSTATRYEFTVAMALDGAMVYTIIAITTGAPPNAAVAATMRMMATAEVGTAPAPLDASGGSSGGLWDKVPTREQVARAFRGVTSVEDAAPFPA